MYECDYCKCQFSYENEDVKYEDVGYTLPYLDFVINCLYCNARWNVSYCLRDKDKQDIAKRLNIKGLWGCKNEN